MTDFALNSPNGRQLAAFAKKMRLDDKVQIADVLHPGVGDTGCAMSLMSLVAVLERAKSGEKILLASYGNGCDVVLLQATDRIGPVSCRGIKGHLVLSVRWPTTTTTFGGGNWWRCSLRLVRRWKPVLRRRPPSGGRCRGKCVSPAPGAGIAARRSTRRNASA